MRDLATSMLRFSWATSLYGAQSVVDWLVPQARSSSPSGPRIPPSPAWASREKLGEPERLAFQALDELQQEGQDWLRRCFHPQSWTPKAFLRSGAELWSGSQRVLTSAAPGRDGIALRLEWRNRLRVYRMVRRARALARNADSESYTGGKASFDLLAALEAERAQPRKGSLWIAEGLAHDWAQQWIHREGKPNASTLGPVLRCIPERFLLPVHAGTGLALAEHTLQGLSPNSPASELRMALDNLEALARDAAAPGFEAAVLESFGLVARCFFPPLVAPLDRQLLGRPGNLRHLFWHGAGRALYFLPLQLVPGVGTADRALGRCLREPPDDSSRRDALGGLAWAFAAVNCHAPVVLERFLRQHGRGLQGTAFETAFREAAIFLHGSAPEASPAPRLLRHSPASAAGGALWRRWILDPLTPLLDVESSLPRAVQGYAEGLATRAKP